ncbi:MAG: hypothetical protein JRF42_13290, partial [Deltaproteobacteria bacterium]|nr:hypothetical protein [Deltaproteobacteria bacterium]
MIKFVQCIRRKRGLTKQEFRDQWVEYGNKVKAVAEASDASRTVLSVALAMEQNL